MLTIEECRSYLGGIELSDEQIEDLRGVLYLISSEVLDILLK